MTIEKGKPWGESCRVPESRVIVVSDHSLAVHQADEVLSLSGGDVWRSLGSPPVPAVLTQATCVRIDAISIDIDNEKTMMAASSVEVGSFIGRDRYLCVANSSFLRNMNIAPRAHPNDGSLDYLEIDPSMSLRQRWIASRRALTGTHIPHPLITTKRVKDIEILRDTRREKLRIDGSVVRDWQSVRLQVLPDHWQVIV